MGEAESSGATSAPQLCRATSTCLSGCRKAIACQRRLLAVSCRGLTRLAASLDPREGLIEKGRAASGGRGAMMTTASSGHKREFMRGSIPAVNRGCRWDLELAALRDLAGSQLST